MIRSECRLALAYLDYRRGRWPEVLARIDECYGFMKDTDNGLYRLRMGRYRAGAVLELGRTDEAAAELGDLKERAARSEASYVTTLLSGTEARLCELRGDHVPAAALYDGMIAALEAAGCPSSGGTGSARAPRSASAATGAAADHGRGEALLAACRGAA